MDNLIFTSGQLPIVPNSGEFIKGDIEKQTIQVLESIKAILERAGSSLDSVIKTTIFIRDISQWKTVNKVYARYLEKGIPPARSVIAGVRYSLWCRYRVGGNCLFKIKQKPISPFTFTRRTLDRIYN